MAKIELDVTEGQAKLFENYCKRVGKDPAVAADNGITNCIHSEAQDAPPLQISQKNKKKSFSLFNLIISSLI